MALHGPHQPAASGKAEQAVIFLHGYGADGNDLIGLASYFAQALPNAAFYSPNAPQPCEMTPYGRQWFSLSAYDPDLMRRDPGTMGPAYEQMVEGTRIAAPTLIEFIEEVRMRENLSSNNGVALVGFSQGTMMSLHVALRIVPQLAGVVGYSGALIGAESLAKDVKATPPVLLIHGTADPVVPFAAMAKAEAALKSAKVPVESIERPNLQHGIDPEGIAHAQHFLRRVFELEDV